MRHEDVVSRLVRRPSRRRVLAVLAMLGALGTGAWLALRRGGEAAVEYQTAAVARQELVVTVTAPGAIEAVDPITVVAPLSGRIDVVYVDEGARVEAGALLATIAIEDGDLETKRTDAEVRQVRAKVADASATRHGAEAALARMERMQASGLASAEQLETARTEAQRARATHAMAYAALDAARVTAHAASGNVKRAQIRAPIAGVVLRRDVNPGATVRVDGAPLFALTRSIDVLRLVAEIDEADIANLAPGAPVTFIVPAWPKREFAGKLVRIRRVPTRTNAGTTYSAIVDLPDPTHRLRPGMSASATFVVAIREDALVVPEAALRWSPNGAGGSREQVYIVNGAGVKAVPVEPGLSDGVSTEVRGGLFTGAPVVVGVASARKHNGIDFGGSR